METEWIVLIGIGIGLLILILWLLSDYNTKVIMEIIDLEYRSSSATTKRDLQRYLKKLDEKPILIRTRSISKEIEFVADKLREKIKNCE